MKTLVVIFLAALVVMCGVFGVIALIEQPWKKRDHES